MCHAGECHAVRAISGLWEMMGRRLGLGQETLGLYAVRWRRCGLVCSSEIYDIVGIRKNQGTCGTRD